MRSEKIQWGLGFKDKRWLLEAVFWNIIHIQTYNWKKVCALWKYTEWWASSRSNGFQKKFFKTIYTFKHTVERSMRSVIVHCVVGFKQKQCLSEQVFQNIIHIQTYKWTKYALSQSTLSHWAVGFKQKQWLLERVFWNIIHIQTYNWTKYALDEVTLIGGLLAEAIAFRRDFLKHYTHSNIWLNKLCALWKYTEGWASRRSDGFQKKFIKTLYTFKNTIEQRMRPGKVHWVMGFNQKQWLSEEVFRNIIHIQTYNWAK